MKKILLGFFALAGLSATAQTYTVDDTLSAGNSETYFVADSSAADLNAVTGVGVTWDYTSLFTYSGIANLDTVKNASDSPDYGNFSNASYHSEMTDGASNYFTNYLDSVISWGYTVTIDGNEAKIMHDIDPMKMMNLPMNYGDTFTDSTYGNAEVFSNSATTAGDVVVTADGTGTLILGANSITNVIRIKLVENIAATIDLGMFGTAQGTVTRTIFSYYDLDNQKEPIFVHATINVNSNLFNGGYTAVYSNQELFGLGIEDEISSSDISVYPNPATTEVNVTIPANVDQVIITNAIGQTVKTVNNPGSNLKFDIDAFETGIYFVQVQRGESTITKKLIVR
ncbi:MAG: T9SS type A sorting domain-containing protein [Crocinitomicaceae bacterium]